MLHAYEDFLPYLISGDPYFNPDLPYAQPYPTLVSGSRKDTGREVKREHEVNLNDEPAA